MLIQLSSGGYKSPSEAQYAISQIFDKLLLEFKNDHISLVDHHVNKNSKYIDSLIFRIDNKSKMNDLLGTWCWHCKSPFRNIDKRNWYIDVSVIPEAIQYDNIINSSDLVFKTCRASGPGGQYVNKTDSAVQCYYKPLDIIVESSESRSQLENKKNCISKINIAINIKNAMSKYHANEVAWSKHEQLVRGNPVRTYTGMDFKLL